MHDVKNCRHAKALIFAAFVCSASSCFADKLHHIDGSVIEGRIMELTGDRVVIETTYGKLNYNRTDLTRIERTAAANSATSGTAAAAPLNLMKYIPQGPVNPLAPPKLPWLVTLAPKPQAAAPSK